MGARMSRKACLPLSAAPALWWTAWLLHWRVQPPASPRAYSWNCVGIRYLEKTTWLQELKVSTAANQKNGRTSWIVWTLVGLISTKRPGHGHRRNDDVKIMWALINRLYKPRVLWTTDVPLSRSSQMFLAAQFQRGGTVQINQLHYHQHSLDNWSSKGQRWVHIVLLY